MSGQLHRLQAVASSWGLDDPDEHRRMVNWLADQINAGRITAYKLGRHWRLDDAGIAEALDVFSNRSKRVVPKRAEVVVDEPAPRKGLSAASARRRIA